MVPAITNPAAWVAPTWIDITTSYMKNTQILACPSDSAADPVNNKPSYVINYSYYGPDSNIFPPTWSGPRFKYVTTSLLAAPSQTIWFMESSHFVGDTVGSSFYWDYDFPFSNPFPPASTGSVAITTNSSGQQILKGDYNSIIARHQNMMNTLYCDGHVKAINLTSLLQTQTSSLGIPYIPALTAGRP